MNKYNPHEIPRDDLISGFILRKKVFERLFEDIRKSSMIYPEQQYLIEGQRGMGKTTLLLRLAYEIESTPELNEWLIPVVLKEEVFYRVNNLEKLWKEIIDNLHIHNDFDPSNKNSDANYIDDAHNESFYFESLMYGLRLRKKKIIVLIDNFNEIIDRFSEKDNQRFREILITCSDVRFVGASSRPLEPLYNYKHALFDFFKIIYLKELDEEETKKFLLLLGQLNKQEIKIKQLLSDYPERVESIRILTGGGIRMLIILFEIFTRDNIIDSFTSLDAILDESTPFYQSRMEKLSPAETVLIDIVALNWDAMEVDEISKTSRMPEEEVTQILNRMENLFIINNVFDGELRKYIQIRERLFNIWYLMRCANVGYQNKVIWLVRFLNTYYSRKELQVQANKHMQSIGKEITDPREVLSRTEILAYTGQLGIDQEDQLIEKSREFLSQKDQKLFNSLSLSLKTRLAKACELHKAGKNDDEIRYLAGSALSVNYFLGRMYIDLEKYEKSLSYLEAALRLDEKNVSIINNIGICFSYMKRQEEALNMFEKTVVCDPGYQQGWYNIGVNYYTSGKLENSIHFYLKASEVDDTYADGYLSASYVYCELKQYEKVIEYFEKAKLIGIKATDYSYCIGKAYQELKRNNEAMDVYFSVLQESGSDYDTLKAVEELFESLDESKKIEISQRKSKLSEASQRELNYAINRIKLSDAVKNNDWSVISSVLLESMPFITITESGFAKTKVFLHRYFERMVEVEKIDLPFFKTFKLYKFYFVDEGDIPAIYMLSNSRQAYPLNLTNKATYSVTETDLILTRDTLLGYIQFFFDVVAGTHGKFYITYKLEQIYWQPDLIAKSEKVSQVAELFRDDPNIEELPEKWVVECFMTFKDSLFKAKVHVNKKMSEISLSDEQLLVEGLPIFEVDAPIRYLNNRSEYQVDDKNRYQKLYELGMIYLKNSGSNDRSRQYLVESLSLNSTFSEAWFELAGLESQSNDHTKAIECYQKAEQYGHPKAASALAWMCYKSSIRKDIALKYANSLMTVETDKDVVRILASVFLWDNQVQDSLTLAKKFLYDRGYIETEIAKVLEYILLLAAKQQYTFLLDYFATPGEDLIDQFKPLYYAVLKLSGSSEFYRLPLELEKTVDDIIVRIKSMAITYL